MFESHHNSSRWARAECEPQAVILSDVTKRGRERPWFMTKAMSQAAAWAYHELGGDYLPYADRIELCATSLKFDCMEVGDKVRKRLEEAKFCHVRTCMVCQWRRSLVLQAQLAEAVEVYLKRNPKHRPIFFTLTVKNCTAAELPATVDKMMKGFDRMRRFAAFDKAFVAWTKRLEISYNEKTGEFHPHLHVMVMVTKEYFYTYNMLTRKNGNKYKDPRDIYVSHEALLGMWQRAMDLDYRPSVDIRPIGGAQGKGCRQITPDELRKAVNETAKYIFKPAGIFKEQDDGTYWIDPQVLKALHDATADRRLVGWGGEFVELRRELNHTDPESEECDLILHKDEKLTEDGDVITADGEILEVGRRWKERYGWLSVPGGGKQYLRAWTDRNKSDWEGEQVGPRPEGGTKADPPPVIH